MKRVLNQVRSDVLLQWRNKLYAIGIGASVFMGLVVSQLVQPDFMDRFVPAFLLLIVGGSTLVYVAAMVLFERDEGTLLALQVSPLTKGEYLLAKVFSLTLLTVCEALSLLLVVYFLGPEGMPQPKVWLIVTAYFLLAIQHTCLGITLSIRYRTITDFLIPMGLVATLLQAPILWVFGITDQSWGWLVPTRFATEMCVLAYGNETQPLSFLLGGALFWALIFWVQAKRAFHIHTPGMEQ